MGDEFYENLEPSFFLWAFHSFLQDFKEKQDFSRQLGLFIGSFANPKMAQDIINSEKNSVEMEDENFDALSEFISQGEQFNKNIKKKKRKLLLNKNKQA